MPPHHSWSAGTGKRTITSYLSHDWISLILTRSKVNFSEYICLKGGMISSHLD
jgi:hypothetical protein